MDSKNIIKHKNRGFTIIEMAVVVAIFLFTIGAAIGIFISVVQNQKKVLDEQQLMNQISYVEEYMSKSLRMAKTAETSSDISCLGSSGYIYLLTRYDTGSQLFRGIKFINQSDNDACQEFFISGTGTTNDPYILKELKNNTNDSYAVALTSKDIQINSIRFSINGSSGSLLSGSDSCSSQLLCGASNLDSTLVQPRVTIVMNINVAGDVQNPTRTIQTTISRRNLNAR